MRKLQFPNELQSRLSFTINSGDGFIVVETGNYTSCRLPLGNFKHTLLFDRTVLATIETILDENHEGGIINELLTELCSELEEGVDLSYKYTEEIWHLINTEQFVLYVADSDKTILLKTFDKYAEGLEALKHLRQLVHDEFDGLVPKEVHWAFMDK